MKTATCHPEKKNQARGLCAACYARLPEQRANRARYKRDASKEVKARRRETQKKWEDTAAGRASRRRKKLLYYYGISLEKYEGMLASQGGVCAICSQPPTSGMSLAVDHCHSTFRVRGLLCNYCNLVIGNARENRGVLERAIAYLDEGREK